MLANRMVRLHIPSRIAMRGLSFRMRTAREGAAMLHPTPQLPVGGADRGIDVTAGGTIS